MTREQALALAHECECEAQDGMMHPEVDDLLIRAAKYIREPQAREDAQPVAWCDPEVIEHLAETRQPIVAGFFATQSKDGGATTALYTHPAPDALRVAVEALETIAHQKGVSNVGVARKALAALQAGQGAK